MNVLILGNMGDRQTGAYISNAFKKADCIVAYLDIRAGIQHMKRDELQSCTLTEVKNMKWKPDIVLVFKGLELDFETLKEIKETFPDAKLINWFFDKYLMDKPIWEQSGYADTLKLYDYYFCSLKGVADKLNECGFDNARYLDEGCDLFENGEVYMNAFQERKYGEDIAFCGSLGFSAHQINRIETLARLVKDGFNIKIWGDVIGEWKRFPQEIKEAHQKTPVINDMHSMVAQSSVINLGIDQDPELELSHSARLYRIMCAGGLYLTTATKGLEKMFKINESKDAPITEDLELVVYYDLDDLVAKCDFLLDNDHIAQSIAKNGQKVVIEKHTFIERVKELIEVIKNDKNNN